MNIGWAEIDKALNNLTVYEAGSRFQRLAISLAQKRWPELIATEIHKDVGEDAVGYAYLTNDGKRFRVQSSITAEYSKLKRDMEKISTGGTRLDFFVFYTSIKVSNEKVKKWQEKFRQQYSTELIVISREHIIHKLIEPENQWMCGAFLGLQVEPIHDIDTIISRCRDAAQKIIGQWQRQTRYDPSCLINIDAITLDEKNICTNQLLDTASIATHLAEGNRGVLKGAPGAGKTTTLIQISELLLNEHQKVPLLISLPDWIEFGEDVITFISKHPNFIAAGVVPKDIVSLHQNGRLVFLFNGWNELDPMFLVRASHQLQQVDREFTAAGIIISSREHHVTPPLLGSLNLVLQSLNDTQRRNYIKSAVRKEPNELIGKIETSKTLDSITRTPLFLSEIVQIYNNGAQIPDTKYGILQSAITRVEQSPEHSTSLQADPLSGRATKYLSALAFAMTKGGRVGMHYEPALTVINKVNEQLLNDGQIAMKPDPQAINDMLCAHHLLEKSKYPVNAIHFIHQQFQEFYAATNLRKQLAELCTSGSEDTIQAFQRDIINIPVWEEPLNILAEDIEGLITANSSFVHFEANALTAGRQLVKWAISVDLFFAAKLVRILGEAVWNEVKGEFAPLLRKWYECENDDHKQCALAAMFATGTGDFSDIIWPLIEHPDQHVRLSSYRSAKTFYLSCLGPHWKERVYGWEEKCRAEFIRELSLNGKSCALEVFDDFARNDPSPNVRATAIEEINWCGRGDKMWQILRGSDDETLKIAVTHEFLLGKIPDDLLPRVKATYQQLLSETDEPNKRLEILLRMSNLNGPECVALLKSYVEKYPIKERSDLRFSNLRDVVAKIASHDPAWASEWVVRKQAEGKLCDEHWSVFITKVPNEIVEQVIKQLLKPNCPDHKVYEVKYLINRGATKEHAHAIIQKLIEIHCQIKGHYVKDKSEMYHRLRKTADAIAWQTLTEEFLEDYSEPENGSLMEVILDLAGCRALERKETRPEINLDDFGKLRTMLRGYSKYVLAANDYSGGIKADLSCALGLFGETKDMGLIKMLIDADIERIRQGRELYRQKIRNDPRVMGASTSWSNWHVRALLRLDPENADKYLFELLKEPEYERDAGWGLVQLLKRNVPKEKFTWEQRPLKIGSAIQESGYIDAVKRKQYSAVLEKYIKDLIDMGKTAEKPDSLTGRLWGLARILASIGEPSSIPIVLEVLQLPGEYGTWTRVETLETLIKNGNKLDTDVVGSVLGQVIAQLVKEGIYNNQNKFLLGRCLSVLGCTSDMPRAIARIKQFVSNYQLGYEMRGVIETLGYTSSSDAANYLIELAQNPITYRTLSSELLQALANIESTESKNAILSIIDPTIDHPKLLLPSKNHVTHIVAMAIAEWCRNDDELKKRVFELCGEKLAVSQREVLANVIFKLSTTEAVVAGLNLISDQSANPVPFFLREAIERSVTEHVPLEDIPNAYNIKPRENIVIRSKLFDMVYDDNTRNGSAFNLLGFIGRLRLEHGSPPMEPRHPNIDREKPWPPLSIFKPEK